jgi:hypothetical protein
MIFTRELASHYQDIKPPVTGNPLVDDVINGSNVGNNDPNVSGGQISQPTPKPVVTRTLYTVNTKIVDDNGYAIAGALALSGNARARSDSKGFLNLKNLQASDSVTITANGYEAVQYRASQFPSIVTLKRAAQQGQPVLNPVKPPINDNRDTFFVNDPVNDSVIAVFNPAQQEVQTIETPIAQTASIFSNKNLKIAAGVGVGLFLLSRLKNDETGKIRKPKPVSL